jgi:hypothetical protein
MTRTFHARYANGVLVPTGNVELPVNTDLAVTVDEVEARVSSVEMPRYDDPNDPRPAGGMALHEWWERHRIQLDPKTAQAIAESDIYLDQDGSDES